MYKSFKLRKKELIKLNRQEIVRLAGDDRRLWGKIGEDYLQASVDGEYVLSAPKLKLRHATFWNWCKYYWLKYK